MYIQIVFFYYFVLDRLNIKKKNKLINCHQCCAWAMVVPGAKDFFFSSVQNFIGLSSCLAFLFFFDYSLGIIKGGGV